MTPSGTCPSRLALQRFASGEPDPESRVAAHLPLCNDCQRRVREYEEWGRAYVDSPAAHSLRQRLGDLEAKAASRPGRTGSRLWAWGGALAAAAALALVLSVGPRDPSGARLDPALAGEEGGQVDALSPKGAAQLVLWLGDEGQTSQRVGESSILHPGDRLQPGFGAPGRGFVALVLITPSGEAMQLHPLGQPQGAPLEARAPAPLGPSFRLDEELGAYRLVAYFSESGFSTVPLVARGSDDAAAFSGLVLLHRFEVAR